jgi:NTP pyrophosphatase (non-canonical NTP hydrolase)
MNDIKTLKTKIKDFIRERDWEQYHAPKNLAMALSVEASEILEIFQWKDAGDPLTEQEQEALAQEIGDVLIYLLELADKFEIDILEAAERKMALNAQKYPADLVRGKSQKYTAYEESPGLEGG